MVTSYTSVYILILFEHQTLLCLFINSLVLTVQFYKQTVIFYFLVFQRIGVFWETISEPFHEKRVA